MKKQSKPEKTIRKHPEWTAEMIAKARPAKKVLPKIFGARVAAAMLKPLTDAKGKVRELTARDLKAFRPAWKALPESLRRKVGVRGPQKLPTKERITIRLSSKVVQSFRATGEGWQTRVDVARQDWLKKHNPAA